MNKNTIQNLNTLNTALLLTTFTLFFAKALSLIGYMPWYMVASPLAIIPITIIIALGFILRDMIKAQKDTVL